MNPEPLVSGPGVYIWPIKPLCGYAIMLLYYYTIILLFYYVIIYYYSWSAGHVLELIHTNLQYKSGGDILFRATYFML